MKKKSIGKKKEQVIKKINKHDPNNTNNSEAKPKIKRRGKKVVDDGFEHRTSKETAK